jgi:hypothetical protein
VSPMMSAVASIAAQILAAAHVSGQRGQCLYNGKRSLDEFPACVDLCGIIIILILEVFIVHSRSFSTCDQICRITFLIETRSDRTFSEESESYVLLLCFLCLCSLTSDGLSILGNHPTVARRGRLALRRLDFRIGNGACALS